MMFIQCYELVHVFITGRRVLRWSKYLSYACERGPSRGWLERQILLPYVYTRPLEWLSSVHFLKTRCIPNPLDFWKKIEEYSPFLRVPLSIVFYSAFRRRLRSCRQIFSWGYHKIWIVCPVLSPWGYPLLSTGCPIIWLLVWRCYCEIIPCELVCESILWFPSDKGDPNVLEGLIHSCT